MRQFARRLIVTAFVATLVAPGYAGLVYAQEKSGPEAITVVERLSPDVRVPESFGSSQIRNWYAPDSETLIIETLRGDFKATFANNCSGIRFAESIGFKLKGGVELDKFTTIVLPDGQTCFFKELVAYDKDEQDSAKSKTSE